jgi:ribosomal protein S18 acetylase RimI-like enzyme
MQEPGVVIREASERDVEEVSRLIVRFYMFNEEFDPAWSSTEDLGRAAEIVKESLEDPNTILLVAEFEGAVIGVARAVIVEEPMLEISPIGILKELYVRPEYRRRGIATRLVEEMSEFLHKKGAKAIAAEFPSRNEVAEAFYEKISFRPFKSIYIRETRG